MRTRVRGFSGDVHACPACYPNERGDGSVSD